MYCYRVASAVGLISIEIFGHRNEGCKQYAIDLGMALQLTNILRDVHEDYENGGRIYLPRGGPGAVRLHGAGHRRAGSRRAFPARS